MRDKIKSAISVGIILAAIVVMVFLVDSVQGMTLDYGECVTLNGTSYCAPNATIAPNITCAWENCTQYVNRGINDTWKVCSEARNMTEMILSSVNGSFYECSMMSQNLSASYLTIQDLNSQILASANCTGRLNASESALSSCLIDRSNALGDAKSEKVRADSAWAQFFQANIVCAIAGAGIYWFFMVRKKSISVTKGAGIYEPKEGI